MSGQVLHPNGGNVVNALRRMRKGDRSSDPKRRPMDRTDRPRADPDKNAGLETYEQEVERASVESVAEHPEGSAPPLERARRFPSRRSSAAGVAA